MNLPEGLYIRDTPAESLSEPPVESVTQIKPRENSNVVAPWEVCVDTRLGHLDVRVFLILKGCQRESGEVRIGRRRIALYACSSQRRVAKSIDKLRDAGWVKVLSGKSGQRARYSIASVKWNPPKAAPSKNAAIAVKRELVRCPKCETRCKQILKVGWCRRCNTNQNIEKISERVTRRVIREEVGTEKTA